MSFLNEGIAGLALLRQNAKDSGKDSKGPNQTGCMVIILLMLVFTLAVAWMVQRFYPGGKQQRIIGRVLDNNNLPLPDAQIIMDDKTSRTGVNGRFQIVAPQEDRVATLKIIHSNYQNPTFRQVNLSEPPPSNFVITMGSPDPFTGVNINPGSTTPPRNVNNTTPTNNTGLTRGSDNNPTVSTTPPPVFPKQYYLELEQPFEQFNTKREGLTRVGENMRDLEVFTGGATPLFTGIWSKAVSSEKLWLDDGPAFDLKNGEFQRDGFQLVDLEMYQSQGGLQYAGLWRSGVVSDSYYSLNLSWEQMLTLRNERSSNGYQLTDMEAAASGNQIRYGGVWHRSGNQTKIWKASSKDEIARKDREFQLEGYGIIDIDLIQEGGGTRYLMVWQQGVGLNKMLIDLSREDFNRQRLTFDNQGMELIDIEEDLIRGSKRFSGIWTAGSSALISEEQQSSSPAGNNGIKLLE